MSLEEKGGIQPLKDGINLFVDDNESAALISDQELVRSMGPAPDPSRIPIVLRPIGSLDIDSKLEKYGAAAQEIPTIEEMVEEFDQLEQPEPKSGVLVQDPMAEAWLAELFKIALSRFGVTSLPLDTIEAVASEKLAEREGMELELWLENLCLMGKLMKIGTGPNDILFPALIFINLPILYNFSNHNSNSIPSRSANFSEATASIVSRGKEVTPNRLNAILNNSANHASAIGS
jgi:hypothetical protein